MINCINSFKTNKIIKVKIDKICGFGHEIKKVFKDYIPLKLGHILLTFPVQNLGGRGQGKEA